EGRRVLPSTRYQRDRRCLPDDVRRWRRLRTHLHAVDSETRRRTTQVSAWKALQRRRDAMVDDRKVVGNTLAFGAAMAYDRIAGAIGPLELSEYLGLAAGRLETTNMRRQRVTSNDQRKHGQTR